MKSLKRIIISLPFLIAAVSTITGLSQPDGRGISREQERKTTEFRIGIPNASFSRSWEISAGRLKMKHAVEVEILVLPSEQMVAALKAGKIDLGMVQVADLDHYKLAGNELRWLKGWAAAISPRLFLPFVTRFDARTLASSETDKRKLGIAYTLLGSARNSKESGIARSRHRELELTMEKTVPQSLARLLANERIRGTLLGEIESSTGRRGRVKLSQLLKDIAPFVKDTPALNVIKKAAAEIDDLAIFIPVNEQRSRWRGDGNLLVTGPLKGGESRQVTSFDINGNSPTILSTNPALFSVEACDEDAGCWLAEALEEDFEAANRPKWRCVCPDPDPPVPGNPTHKRVYNTQVELSQCMDFTIYQGHKFCFDSEWYVRVNVFRQVGAQVEITGSWEINFNRHGSDINVPSVYDWTTTYGHDVHLFDCPITSNPGDPTDPGNSTGALFVWVEWDSTFWINHPDSNSVTIAAISCPFIPSELAPSNGLQINTFDLLGNRSSVLNFWLRKQP